MSESKYTQSEDTITLHGSRYWISYTKQSDGSIVLDSNSPDIEYHDNPVTGKEADELWDNLKDSVYYDQVSN